MIQIKPMQRQELGNNKETLYEVIRMCVCVTVPAICEEKLEVSHVHLPQRHAVALCQWHSNFVHVVIQSPGTQTGSAEHNQLSMQKKQTWVEQVYWTESSTYDYDKD